MSKQVEKLADIEPDKRNPNKHTARGRAQLETSMRKFGFMEPGVLDKNNRIIAGNHRTETQSWV